MDKCSNIWRICKWQTFERIYVWECAPPDTLTQGDGSVVLTNPGMRWLPPPHPPPPQKKQYVQWGHPRCFLSRVLDAAIIAMLTILGVLICARFWFFVNTRKKFSKKLLTNKNSGCIILKNWIAKAMTKTEKQCSFQRVGECWNPGSDVLLTYHFWAESPKIQMMNK